MADTKNRTYETGVAIILAMLVMSLPLPWIIGLVCAVIVHEMGHYIAVFLITGEWAGVEVQLFRIRMRIPAMCCRDELICALSGPVAGMLLLFLQPVFPKVAFCALVQSAFNLLPIYPLDGGRALECVLSMVCRPDSTRKICGNTETVCKFMVMIVAFYVTLRYDLGLYAFAIAGIILIPRK